MREGRSGRPADQVSGGPGAAVFACRGRPWYTTGEEWRGVLKEVVFGLVICSGAEEAAPQVGIELFWPYRGLVAPRLRP